MRFDDCPTCKGYSTASPVCCPTCQDSDGHPTGRVCVMSEEELNTLISWGAHSDNSDNADYLYWELRAELAHRRKP